MQSVHNPTITVKLASGGSVEIRELSWPDALELYGKVREQVQRIIGENGQINLNPATLVAVVTENIELGTWLVKKSTGKDDNWLMQRSLSEVLDAATESAVLNLGIILERIKNARSRLASALAGANPIQSISDIARTPATPIPKSS